MGLNKVSFNSLSVEEQVNFFNNKLHEGNTISKICNGINISYNTVRDRFKRHNFIYNKFINQYECKIIGYNHDESLLDRAIEKIALRIFKDAKDNGQILNCNLDGNVINRSFRVYDDVSNEFAIYCEKSKFTQYDILSKFIKEGMEKYQIH